MHLQMLEELIESEHCIHVLLDVEQIDALVEDDLEVLPFI